MGPNVEMGDVQEAIHLNRLLRQKSFRRRGRRAMGARGDPRHVEILVSQMELSNESKAVSTPGCKELGAEDRACYRSWTMRASYLSQDRCELQFAVKELARRMQQPNTKNLQALTRLVRFLKGSPRCLVVHNRQDEQPIVDVFSDSDWVCATVDFVFVRDAWWAYPCLVGNNSKCGATSWRSGVQRVAVAVAADMAKVVKTTCTCGRHSVEGDCLKARSGASETSPYPSLVGARGGGSP